MMLKLPYMTAGNVACVVDPGLVGLPLLRAVIARHRQHRVTAQSQHSHSAATAQPQHSHSTATTTALQHNHRTATETPPQHSHSTVAHT